ncbi:hypothetical protein I8748_03760 [Nostoc sp. CENA67]|uniref:Uncharacterized protein n=1 Tax=Amazonocrinis nigriterrae CENA67 TaxID=2794033 RepID=A0A8J7HS29_9NOST|nr:hypothetical protein [Amazonocrinis nigriterrae]MBH8561299.1 hypothetical protein [Amazonocrinis nigriterrae CENA67]
MLNVRMCVKPCISIAATNRASCTLLFNLIAQFSAYIITSKHILHGCILYRLLHFIDELQERKNKLERWKREIEHLEREAEVYMTN